jgi:hypothetical protein
MTNLDPRLVSEINKKIEAFDKNYRKNTTVEIDKTPEGQFIVVVQNKESRITICHSWSSSKGGPRIDSSFANPTTIDIVFRDLTKDPPIKYLMIVSECELSLFPKHLDEARQLTDAFLSKSFKLERSKTLWFHRDVVVFDTNTRYKHATKIK